MPSILLNTVYNLEIVFIGSLGSRVHPSRSEQIVICQLYVIQKMPRTRSDFVLY